MGRSDHQNPSGIGHNLDELVVLVTALVLAPVLILRSLIGCTGY